MTDTGTPRYPTILTIGHSSHSVEGFLRLLRSYGIDVLVDVRSSPRSRFVPQFNQEVLRKAVPACGIRYVYFGHELGGRPPTDEYYDDEGFVLYSRIAASPQFAQGVLHLVREAERHRVAVMCSEENPAQCHRRLLIGRVLAQGGACVLHVRGDGRLQSEDDVAREEDAHREQPGLFDLPARSEWKSARSVSPRRRRRASSGS